MEGSGIESFPFVAPPLESSGATRVTGLSGGIEQALCRFGLPILRGGTPTVSDFAI